MQGIVHIKVFSVMLLNLLFSLVIPVSGQPSPTFEHLTVTDGLSQNTVNDIFKDTRGFIWIGTNDGLNRYDGYTFRTYQFQFNDSTSLSNNRVYEICEDEEGNLWVGTRGGLNRYNRDTDDFTRFMSSNFINSPLTNNFVRALLFDSGGNLWIGTLGGGLHVLPEGSDEIRWLNPSTTGPDKNRLHDLFISDISEDASGNIWVATRSMGINRLDYDRIRYIFHPFQPGSFDTNHPLHTKTILHDSKGMTWVCTEGNGLYKMDIANNRVDHYTKNDASGLLQSNIVKDIIEDRSNNIWIATDGGGLHFIESSGGKVNHIRLDPENPNSINSDAIYTIFQDDQEIFWIGTFAGGINIYDKGRTKFKNFTHESANANSLSHPSVLCFSEDADGSIWIGTDGGGLNHYDPRSEQFELYCSDQKSSDCLSSKVITSLLIDSKDRLWVGTYNGGLDIIDREQQKIMHFGHIPGDTSTLRNNNIWAIHEDFEGNIWIGTSDGLHRFNASNGTFTFIKPPFIQGIPFQGRVSTIYEDDDHVLWFGGANIYWLSPDRGRLEIANIHPLIDRRIQDFEIRAIYRDSENRLWIGTEGGGLVMYISEIDSVRFYSVKDGLPNNSIHRIIEDDNGYLWLSTNHGISKLNPRIGAFRNYDFHDGLQSNQFSYSGAMKSSTGHLYFGGVEGFNSFHPDSIRINTYIPPIVITDLLIFNRPVDIGVKNSPLQRSISETDQIILKHSQSVITFNFTALNYTSPERNQYEVILEGFEDEWRNLGTQRSATFTNLDAGNFVFKVRGSNNDLMWNDVGTSLQIRVLPPWYKSWYAYIIYALIIFSIMIGYQRAFLKQARLRHDLEIKELEKSKIEELNQLELRFFTNISHEFKTPITLIQGPLEQIIAENNYDEKTGKKLQIMRANTRRLLRLINQLLEFRKVKQSTLDLRVKHLDLNAFLREIKEVFDELAEVRKIDFSFYSDVGEEKIWFDPDKIEKILYNLLSNAFKHTQESGYIILKASKEKKPSSSLVAEKYTSGIREPFILISVTNSGKGIPKEKIEKIFERFYMLDDQHLYSSSMDSGSGIGLSLSKSLIERHYGYIAAESAPNDETTFSIAFPSSAESYNEEERMSSTVGYDLVFTRRGKEELFQITDPLDHNSPVVTGEDRTDIRVTVLLAEDNREMRNYIEQMLEEHFRIITADNGQEAYEITRQTDPDILVTDIMMPVMDGMELCKKIKQEKETSHIPVIMLTAKGEEEDKIRGLKTGADDYITKPFHPDELLQKLKNIASYRKSIWERFQKSSILEPTDIAVTSFDEKFLKNAVRAVEEHIDDPEFDVSGLVAQTGMSRSVMYRKLKALTGQSANEFINTIRLKRAAQLLKKQKLSVSEITYMVGYNDPQYFSKCFKKQFGETPSQYASRTNTNNQQLDKAE